MQVNGRIRIYHNEARDADGRWSSINDGFRPETAKLRSVIDLHGPFEVRDGAGVSDIDVALAELAYEIGNIDLDMAAPPLRPTIEAYRTMRLRSLSVGDVVVVTRDGISNAYAVERAGWRKVDLPAGVTG